MDDWLARFVAEEKLPESFAETVEHLVMPFADRAADWREDFGRTAFVGLCGAQGSGKSTVAAATVRLLATRGVKAVAMSLDDFYLGREARGWLAKRVHRLLQVRGPPGTHDIILAAAVLDHMRGNGITPVPVFDKATDERLPKTRWRSIEGPVDVVILEGWCVGARPEPIARLMEPVNVLERRDDPARSWRTYINRQLAEGYQGLFGRLDRLVLLQAPGFEVVRDWRIEQEQKLRERTGGGMSDAEVGRFVQHYERLTRWIVEEMPGRADWVVPLRPDRTPVPQV